MKVMAMSASHKQLNAGYKNVCEGHMLKRIKDVLEFSL